MADDRNALAEALDYFRPNPMSRDQASIVLTVGKMRGHLAVIEAALRSDAGAEMRVELRPDTSANDALETLPILDEAVITNVASVHAEMMSDKQLWIGFDGHNGEHARLVVDAEFEGDGSRRFVLRLRGEDEGKPSDARAKARKAGTTVVGVPMLVTSGNKWCVLGEDGQRFDLVPAIRALPLTPVEDGRDAS